MSTTGVLHEMSAPYAVPSVLFYPLFIITVILGAIYVKQNLSRMYKMGKKIPGPPTLPIIGNVHQIYGCKNSHELMMRALEIGQDYKDVIRAFFGSNLIVCLTHPEDIEIILSSNVHINKSTEYRFFKPWLGEGLLISSGERWKSHRKIIAPTFHMNILKSFMDAFNRNSRQTVDKLRKEVGKEFDVHDYMSSTTVDILLETAMGVTKRSHDSAGFDYAMAVMKMCDIIHQRHYKVWLRSDAVFNWTGYGKLQKKFLETIHGLTNKVIKIRKQDYINAKKSGDHQSYFEKITEQVQERENLEKQKKTSSGPFKGLRDDLDDYDDNDIGEKKRLAFLDFMIESSQNGNNIDDNDIKEEVDTIMFEGHDTTAAGSSFVLCLLGQHQHIQEKVMEEISYIFGDSDRPCTFADTVEMKYLERVIFETLRMYPPVPIIAREITEDVTLATQKYVVPAGTTIVIGTYLLHRRPDIYPNPEVFDPDNFLPERCSSRHFYSFVPFSAGPRSCVGRKYAVLKLKVLISTILRNFKITTNVPEKDFKLQGDIILKRSDGFRIKLEPRV